MKRKFHALRKTIYRKGILSLMCVVVAVSLLPAGSAVAFNVSGKGKKQPSSHLSTGKWTQGDIVPIEYLPNKNRQPFFTKPLLFLQASGDVIILARVSPESNERSTLLSQTNKKIQYNLICAIEKSTLLGIKSIGGKQTYYSLISIQKKDLPPRPKFVMKSTVPFYNEVVEILNKEKKCQENIKKTHPAIKLFPLLKK